MDRLETRELVYFVTVAEELHFSRAAERLGIAQPPLSRAVSRLERRMGVRLLERTSRRVELTAAGLVFLDECRRLLRALDAAVQRTQRAVTPSRLVLAVRPGTGSGLLARILRSHDGPEPELVFTNDRAAALRDGTADIALLCTDSDDLTDLRTTEVAEESPVALLPRDHPLARRTTVTTAELRQEPAYLEHCPPMGLDEILDRVALGRLITVAGSGTTDRLTREVTAVPVTDLPPTTLALGWLPRTSRPEIVAFARTAERIAAESVAAEHIAAEHTDTRPLGEPAPVRP
ncbi:LysR family transcriptional regulator [Streptomyces pseudovenezuelae]|uniref:DNA-binding transcriptional LysR family regulator n=1 Tax=Streptomyces pseudovenezuelae TaxID=67350 RepID=A0ABT6LEZ6_9ACTN|nr:LysR family transcriptional regulator [Streptomyces pseudovenezuelae]MDH6214883.1 DNA-binding transcriptional LysR family regulator [Streptomyces pseudovenezuelae]